MDINYITEHLVKEIDSSPIYDKESIKAKIKAALTILIDEELKKEASQKLEKKVKTHVNLTEQHNVEIKFWKDVVRTHVKEENMQPYYNEIDSILIQKGFKTMK